LTNFSQPRISANHEALKWRRSRLIEEKMTSGISAHGVKAAQFGVHHGEVSSRK